MGPAFTVARGAAVLAGMAAQKPPKRDRVKEATPSSGGVWLKSTTSGPSLLGARHSFHKPKPSLAMVYKSPLGVT